MYVCVCVVCVCRLPFYAKKMAPDSGATLLGMLETTYGIGMMRDSICVVFVFMQDDSEYLPVILVFILSLVRGLKVQKFSAFSNCA